MAEPLKFFTTRGRFVSGDMDKLKTVDHQRKPKPADKQQYEFGIAFPKQEIWGLLAEQMYPWLMQQWTARPDLQQRLNAWFQKPGLKGSQGGLSMKIADGDEPNAKGQVNEHTKGCFVFYMTSFGMGDATKAQVSNPAEPPRILAGPNAHALQDIDLSHIHRGDYVAISGTVQPNGNDGNNAGVYLNCNFVWLLEKGEKIVGGVDPADAFGGANLQSNYDPTAGAAAAFGGQPPLPGGSPAPAPAPTAPAQPMQPPAAPAAQQYSAPPQVPASPSEAPPPHTGYMQPPAPQQPAAPAPAPGYPPLPGGA